MTNEEVIQKAHEEFALRGLSHYTVEEYLDTLHIFLRYYEDRPLETMSEHKIRNFLLYQIEIGKAPGCVNNYNSTLPAIISLFNVTLHIKYLLVNLSLYQSFRFYVTDNVKYYGFVFVWIK